MKVDEGFDWESKEIVFWFQRALAVNQSEID
jgi:hypothetical protein